MTTTTTEYRRPSEAARLTVWDEDTAENIAAIPMKVSVVQMAFDSGEGDGPNFIGLWLESTEKGEGDVLVRPEWVGKRISVEVKPSAVSDLVLGSQVDRMASKWDAVVI